MNRIKVLIYSLLFIIGGFLIFIGSESSSTQPVSSQQNVQSTTQQQPSISAQQINDLWREIASKLGVSFISASIIAIILEFFLENPFDQVRERIDKATEKVEEEVLLLSTGMRAGVNSIYVKRSDIPQQIFKEKLEANPESIDVLAAAGGKYTSDLINLIFDQKIKGSNVRLLFPDPTSQPIQQMRSAEGVTNIGSQIEATISTLLRVARDRDFDREALLEMIRFYNHTVQCSFTRFDGSLIVTHYLAKWWGDGAPTLIVRRGTNGLFESYLKHFNILWEDFAKPFSDYMNENNITY